MCDRQTFASLPSTGWTPGCCLAFSILMRALRQILAFDSIWTPQCCWDFHNFAEFPRNSPPQHWQRQPYRAEPAGRRSGRSCGEAKICMRQPERNVELCLRSAIFKSSKIVSDRRTRLDGRRARRQRSEAASYVAAARRCRSPCEWASKPAQAARDHCPSDGIDILPWT